MLKISLETDVRIAFVHLRTQIVLLLTHLKLTSQNRRFLGEIQTLTVSMIIATKWRFLRTSEDVSILEEIDESGRA